MKIKNRYGESLDFVIEGNHNAKATVLFVHGFGTNKDENSNLFVDMAEGLSAYRIIRFDFSGYGKSQGKQEDVDLHKQAMDLKTMIDYVRSHFYGELNIVAFSLGCFTVLMLSPEEISKTVFISIPGSDTKASLAALKKRIKSRPGGKVNEGGISTYPRADGALQKLGQSYWKTLRGFDPVFSLEKYSEICRSAVFRPLQDEIVATKQIEDYKKIKSIGYFELSGNHGFTTPKDRKALIEGIKKFLSG